MSHVLRARALPALALALAASGLSVLPATATAAPSTADALSAPGDVWTAVTDRPTARRGGLEQRVAPSSYAGYHLDLGALETRLDRAPAETAGTAPLTIAVPSPTGELVEFAVAESPVMEPGLAELHPDITTYAGATTGDVPATIRLDVTPMGFHASVRSPGSATWYVDPAYNGVDQGADALYLSYLGQDLPEPEKKLVEPELPGLAKAVGKASSAPSIGEGGGAVAIQRTYRLALITDPSYAASFNTTSDAVVTAEKTTLMNRVNQVYGDDLSVRLNLVAGTDALNFNTAAQFTGANGRCGNLACYSTTQVSDGCNTTAPTGTLDILDQNRLVAGQIIGADAYDIGHIAFGPDGDGGGVAGLGVVGTVDKAVGCTGLAPPFGDGFAIDYVAHEMGHQFSGNHTFNGTSGSCSAGNRNAGTSVEPGSGISVMAYAGICGVDNLQNHSDPYFSQRSQTEIAAYIRSTQSTIKEIQSIALSGFGTGESFTISYPGGTTQTVPFASYTAAGLKTAVEAAEPSTATATIGGFWGAGTVTPTLTNGFQVTWSGTVDIPKPSVAVAAGDFTSIVGTLDNGGAATNGGFNNPTPSGNRNPTVTAPVAKTIPIRTPFSLTGSGTDLDGDSLVYLWEQNDVKSGTGTALNSNTKASGPLFRIFGTYALVTAAGSTQTPSPGINLATTSPTRSFPDAAQVAAGETNAATGSCPAYTGTGTADTAPLRCFSEFLPTTARTMSFRLTARDLGGADGGPDGGTSFADTAITVGTAGPFAVTSQATATSVTGLAAGALTWNVASTNTATYATNVKISFSTDGGLTFPTVLAASTPNDGSETIAWPNVATTQGRFKVEAVDNYFYDVNDGNITITPVAGTPTLTTGGTAAGATFSAASSDPLSGSATITASSSSVDGSAITATPTGLPAGLALTQGSSSAAGVRPGTTTFTVTGTADVDPGSYPVSVVVADGAAAPQTVTFTVVVAKDAATLTYTGDTSGATGTRTVSVTVADTDATPGTVAGSVAFTDQTTGDALCTATIASGVASCTFNAPATRTYQVVGTLTSTRYSGASAPAALTVAAAPTLTTGGTAAGATFTAASSDPLSGSATITASSSSVDGSAITATPTGLPAGLALTQGSSSAAGVRPGTTTFTVTGTADVDPGSYPVSVVVADGAAAPQTVTFTVVVAKDAATLTYTGDTSGATGTRTVSVTVADTDATPGTVAGSVAFTDQTTGDALCTATIASGVASCTFNAPATRTYQVVGTLTSTRYTGASAPAALVVTAPATPTLTTGGNASGTTFTAASSDALSTTPTITAESNTVAGSAITMVAAGLPTGLVLGRTASTSTGTTFTVTGTANVDPGTYPVTVTVSDGANGAADQTVAFTVVVTKDAATVTYTGPSTSPGGTITLSASVADTDTTPGTVAGTVAFIDQTSGDALCTATIASGTASCAFNAPTTRTYQVVATLTSTRYTGASSPAALVVTVPATPTLTTGGNASGTTFTAASSDALSTTPTITAESNTVAGSAITMVAAGLPDGLVLGRTASTSTGTTFTVTGTATDDPGSYPVTVTVSDGANGAADQTVSFTVVVTKDAATLTYTGDTTGTGGAVTVSTTVADTDTTPGTVTGTVTFTDQTTNEELCVAPVTSGAASCTFTAASSRVYQVVGTLTSDRYTGASAATPVVVTVGGTPSDTTPPDTRITAGPAANSLQVAGTLTFRFASEPGARYLCSLDRRQVVACNNGTISYRNPPSGSYDFRVSAVDAAGNIDRTPAVRRFYVPVRDRALAVAKGPWKRRVSTSSYRGSFTTVAKKGAELRYRVSGATTLALVLSNGRAYGAVDVYLGNRKLKTLRSTGAPRARRLASVASFRTPVSGVVRIVTRTKRPVRIEGLAIRTTAATRRMAGRPGAPF